MNKRPSILAASFLLTGLCSGPSYAQEQGYLCCNLRSDGSWISDSNYLESGKTMIPFGTPVKVTGQGRYRVHLEIDGKRQSIGNDYSRDLAMDAFQRKYVVPEDPRRLVAALPPKVRQAIETMRITPGMTRAQVAIAIGWPITSENPQLEAKTWKYWLWSFSPFDVHFDDAGRVRTVESDPETLAKVFLR